MELSARPENPMSCTQIAVVDSGLAGCEDTQPEAVIMNSMSAAAPKPWARMARRFGAVLHQGTHVFQRAAHDLSRG